MSPADCAKRVRELAATVHKPLLLAFRRSMTTARTGAVNELRQVGVGRALWGRKPKGARLMVKRVRVKFEDGKITGGLEAKGLAAMVERGGKTERHEIKPKLAKVLSFHATATRRLGEVLGLRQGSLAAAMKVQHPGSRVPAQPYLAKGFQKGLDRFNTEADPLMQQHIDKVVG